MHIMLQLSFIIEVCTTDGGQRCIFPFIYDGKTYDNCTEPGGYRNRPWCAYTVTYQNKYDDWDYCRYCGKNSNVNDSILFTTFLFI